MQRYSTAIARLLLLCMSVLPAQATGHQDPLIRNDVVYDGRGAPPKEVDVAMAMPDRGLYCRVAQKPALIALSMRTGSLSPGFIITLRSGTESLIEDGRGMPDAKPGITLACFNRERCGVRRFFAPSPSPKAEFAANGKRFDHRKPSAGRSEYRQCPRSR